MGKSRRRAKSKLQPKTAPDAQKVVGQSDRNLLEQPASKIRLLAALIIVVCAVVIVVHWPALSAKALSFDDEEYLTDNVLVQNPGWTSARRFLTEVLQPSTVRGYYQPLTMISLMVDYALGGRADNLLPFHRTSLALHVANTALVIILLYLLFGHIWIAAAVGLLFGIHPMTVEPIPWLSDRKTLLAAFFAFWSLILYVRFTRKGHWLHYIGCLVMYLLALMSKPTSTPLPLLMLLLDFWPLRRWRWRCVLEKLPFFILGALFAIITYVSQSRTYGVRLPGQYGSERIPLVLCHNIIFYLTKISWPANLSSYYSFPQPFGLSHPRVLTGVIGTCILIPLLVISLRWTRVLLTGWLFFFIAILPTMQIIGFSELIAADKFVYLPSLGLLLVLTSLLIWFCGAGGVKKYTRRCVVMVIVVLVLAVGEAVATRRYLVHWRDVVSLHEHMLTVTPNSAQAHFNFASALEFRGELDEAVRHYRKALQLSPSHFNAHNNLGNALSKQRKLSEAIRHYQEALKLKPDYAKAYNNLGVAFKSLGKIDEAIKHYRRAIELNPNYAPAYYNLGGVFQAQRKFKEAITCYRKVLQIKPKSAKTHNSLASALAMTGRVDEAIKHFREALRLDPSYAPEYKKKADLLQSQGIPDESNIFLKALSDIP